MIIMFFCTKIPKKTVSLRIPIPYRRFSLFTVGRNNEFWNRLEQCSAYKSPASTGFSWITKDEELYAIVQKHFKEVLSTFHLVAEVKENIRTTIVEILPIDQSPFNKSYYFNQIPHESVSIGGPSALVMAYFESERYHYKHSSLRPPIFATQSATDSNAYGSALQIHQRYAQRMAYTDSKYEGWNLLRVGLQRLFSKRTLHEALSPDYLTVDFDWKPILQNAPLNVGLICIKNEWLTWQDKINRWRGAETTGAKTYPYAKESVRLLKSIDAEVGGILTQEGALNICLSDKEALAMTRKNKWLLKSYGIESFPVSAQRLKKEYGLSPEFFPGGGAFYYPEEGHLRYDFWAKLEKAVLRYKGLVESWTLKKIVLTSDLKKVLGIVVEGNHGERFIRTEKVYASLGYAAQYRYKDSKLNGTLSNAFETPIENVTTATGFSGFALIMGHHQKVPIAFNSHHTTKMAESWDSKQGALSLVKTTGGALIGSPSQYQVQHAVNNIWYNEKIFGEKFRLFAAKACSRSLNSQNSGKFTFFPGLVIGTGRGGKGVTDMCADAVVAGQLLRQGESPYRQHSLDNIASVEKKEHCQLFPKTGMVLSK